MLYIPLSDLGCCLSIISRQHLWSTPFFLRLSVLPPSYLAGLRKPSACRWSAKSYKCQEQQKQKVRVAQYRNTRLGESKGKLGTMVPCLSRVWCTNTPPPEAFLLRTGSGNSTSVIITEASVTPGALVPRAKLSTGSVHSLQRSFCWQNMCMVQILSCTGWSSHPESWCYPHAFNLLNLLCFREVILTCGRVA